MRTIHYKQLICSGESFKAAAKAMRELTYEARMERGFVVEDDAPSFIRGKYYYTKMNTVKSIDRVTLKPIEEKSESLCEVLFTLDLRLGLVSVEGRRNGLSALYEALDALPDVGVEFQDLHLNLKDYVFELQHAFNKNEIRVIKVKDYLARENALASPSFKLVDVREGEKLVEKWSDQAVAVKLDFKLPSGKVSFGVQKRGTLSFTDDTPTELMDYAREQLPRFHEAEVETAEIRGLTTAR